ncbi:Holliday junction ATP-dependent DNA helicase RuvA [Spirochaetia bacterium]|nr:Holliday junction ATP-dependent DNA helicase RuvA [Spirochaetia bacterium]
MFNSLNGIIREKHGDSLLILTGGVEWELTVPSRDLDDMSATGEEGRVFTWLSHRENEMKLFGFATEQRRATFLELLKVEGIGPKGAVKIMGGISQGELLRALESGDLGRLEAVPGLGKKTAQKMILALKGKIVQGGTAAGEVSPYNELANALVDMGYDKKAALEALNKAASSIPESGTSNDRENAIFRQAILFLSR